VRGFIVKDAPADTLADGIRRVAAGERVDPELVAAALETGASPLTERETDVLRVADRGIIEAFVRDDPYVQNGLVTSWNIREWSVAVGAG